MAANTIATARRLVEKGGYERRAAEAAAEEFVSRADDSIATKTDVARLEGEQKNAKTEAKSLSEKMDNLDGRFDRMEDRFDRVDARLDRMDERFDRTDERLNRMEGDQKAMKGQINLLIAIMLIVAAAVLTPLFQG